MTNTRWLFTALFVIATKGPRLAVLALKSPEDEQQTSNKEHECRVYLAKTTIPNAGMGIFAGIDFDPDDMILYADVAVPVDDMPFHTGSLNPGEVQGHFIWGDYTWDTTIAEGIDFDYEGVKNLPDQVLATVELASFGLGAMPNCKFGFVNLHSTILEGDSANLDRNSAGNGAFTPYHARKGLASESIVAGAELFENYGGDYFDQRDSLLHVPQENDYRLAAIISKKLLKFRDDLKSEMPESFMLDLYRVVKNSWHNSRVTNALPSVEEIKSNASNLDLLLEKGPKHFEKRHTIRDVAWLRENGQCMDGLKSGLSTIPDAGRGAFATRRFQKGTTIAPVPLIHIADNSVFDMYEAEQSLHEAYEYDEEYGEQFYYPKQRNLQRGPIKKALLLNYCFGHKNSTMLLSPYGSITSLINHGSGQDANARMVWADDWMTHPEWLQMTPDELKKKSYAGLAWDLIALRDIEPGEEVLIDYGSDWSQAWAEHAQKWNMQKHLYTGTSNPYVPAAELNENIEQVLMHAVEHNIDYTYMGHGVSLYCYNSGKITDDDDDDDEETASAPMYQECRPVTRHASFKGETLFTVEIIDFVEVADPNGHGDARWEQEVYETRFGVPASNFHFEELPFNAAHRMPWAFRHEMMVPDDLFPEAWMNLNYQQDSAETHS